MRRSSNGVCAVPGAIPRTGFSVISPCRWRLGIRDGIGESRRHSRRNRRGGGAGDRVRLWADGTIWKARKTASKDRSAQGAAWSAAGQRAGDSGGPAIELTPSADRKPIAERADRPYVVSNGDVDASQLRRRD